MGAALRVRMQDLVVLGLAGLGLASSSFALLAAASFVRDAYAAHRHRREARKLGPFRDASAPLPPLPSIGGPSYALAAAVALSFAFFIRERREILMAAATPQLAARDVSERLVAGDPTLDGLGHVVRATAPITGLGGEQDGDVLRIDVHGASLLDSLAPIARVRADVDRVTLVEHRGESTVIEIRFVEGRRPRWSVEAIGDSVVIRLQ